MKPTDDKTTQTVDEYIETIREICSKRSKFKHGFQCRSIKFKVAGRNSLTFYLVVGDVMNTHTGNYEDRVAIISGNGPHSKAHAEMFALLANNIDNLLNNYKAMYEEWKALKLQLAKWEGEPE
jgi:hypothetical protein